MRDELLDETLFLTIGQARSILARWVDDSTPSGRTRRWATLLRPPSLPGSNGNGRG